jgi:hypothetical protein
VKKGIKACTICKILLPDNIKAKSQAKGISKAERLTLAVKEIMKNVV